MFIILSTYNKNVTIAFFLTLIPTIIMGTGTSFGEATILGYIRNFPKDYVSGWSSGSGVSGIVGCTISFLSKKKEWELKKLYLFVSPVAFVYFFLYFASKKIKEKLDKNFNFDLNFDNNIDNDNNNEILNSKIDENLNYSNVEIKTDVTKNKEMTIKNFIYGFKMGKRYILNLAIVYYLEKTIQSGICERVSKKKEEIFKEDFYFKNSLYESFLLCYHIGVFFSLSSLTIVKNISFVEIFSILQTINLFLWTLEYYSYFIKIYWICFIHLFFVGLNGGASYVGCFYFIMASKTIQPEFKELCLNIGTIFNDIGVLFSSITALILDNTIMKIKK